GIIRLVTADRGSALAPTHNTLQPERSHQSFDATAGDGDALPAELSPDLARAVDMEVFIPVELRLDEKCCGLTQDLVGPFQLQVLAFELIETLSFRTSQPGAFALVTLGLPYPQSIQSDCIHARISRHVRNDHLIPNVKAL